MPPLIVLGVAWLAGMAWVGVWDAPLWLPGLTIALLLPVALTRDAGIRPWLVGAAAVAALAGAWRYADGADSDLPALASRVGEEVVIAGTITSLPDPGLTTARYEFAVDHAGSSDDDLRQVSGKVLLTVGQYEDWAPGTGLLVAGELEAAPVFADFDYRGYLARQGIVGTMLFPDVQVIDAAPWTVERVIGETRLQLEDGLQRSLPEPEASLASGIVLGLDGNIPPELYDDYRRAGLAHIIAVSGSNVALLTGMVFVLLVPLLGRNLAIAPAALVVLLYVLLAGAEAAVLRAGIMAAVFLLGLMLGRQQSGVAALSFAAIVMTLVSPSASRDIGFQLSLAATAGLLVFGPWIDWALMRVAPETVRRHVPRGMYYVAAWTIASTIATAPLLWLHFGELSTVGVAANLLIEPVFAVALALSLLTAVGTLIWEPLGWLMALVAWYPLALMNWTAGTLGSQPWASVPTTGATPTRTALAYFAMLAVGAVAFRFPPRSLDQERSVRMGPTPKYAYAAVAGALVVAPGWFSLRPAGGPGDLVVDFLDVGQGDAVLVTTPAGTQVLIDGGPSGLGLARELGDVMPHWDRRIDYVVLTHPQQDHVAGLVELGRRFEVGQSHVSRVTNSTATHRLFERAFEERDRWQMGDSVTIDGVVFEVLWPPPGANPDNLNDASLVLRIEYGGTSLLLTGDIESPAQMALLAGSAELRAEVLKVPHHGAETSSAAFFNAVGAGLAVVSVGEDNRFGHPSPNTIEALQPATIVRTDEDGRVRVVVDERGRVAYSTER